MGLRELVEQFREDARNSSLTSAIARAALWSWFALTERELFRGVLREPAYALHVAAVQPRDRFGFAAHRFYLVRGLSRRARGLAALAHYRHEATALDPSYLELVYRRGGLQLWHAEHEETSFELRLLPGRDVMNEGGLSVISFANGLPTAILSYSNVDPRLLGHVPAAGDAPLVPFITRRQGSLHDFRAAFTRAFGRGTPGHFCIAALEGIALAQGCSRILAIGARRHLARHVARKGGRAGLEDMYDAFWRSLSGEPGRLAWRIPVPLRPTPLDQLDSKNRRRAHRLRGHQAEIRDSAFRAYRALLVSPPATCHEPAPTPAPTPGHHGSAGDALTRSAG